MSSIIRTDHLTMTYGVNTPFEKVAVNDLNIEIMEGEFLGIIGHTGSGKSTLVQMLNGLITPTTGKVLLRDKDINENKKKLREVRFSILNTNFLKKLYIEILLLAQQIWD